MATHSPVRRDSRMHSAMSDLLAQPLQEEAAISFETKLTGREVESRRLWRIFLIMRRVASMMLGDDLGFYGLVLSDDNPPTRTRAKEGYVQPSKHVHSK